MEVSHQWVTTEAIYDVCGNVWQLVFECDIITEGEKSH